MLLILSTNNHTDIILGIEITCQKHLPHERVSGREDSVVVSLGTVQYQESMN